MHGSLSEPCPPEIVAHVEGRVRASGTSFYWAMRLLPEEKRRAMYAIYAFCREVDDIADEPAPQAVKEARLQEWREEVVRILEGRPSLPVARALADAVSRFGLSAVDLIAVIDGMAMDAEPRVRVADSAALAHYCDLVACAVGRLSNRVFGIPPERGNPLARALGEALQLTNILRDLDEDASRDRLYLPADLLARQGIASDEPALVLAHPALPAACEDLADLTERRFIEAAIILAGCDRGARRAAVMMMEVYRRIFRRLRIRGWLAPRAPVSLSASERAWLVLRHGFG